MSQIQNCPTKIQDGKSSGHILYNSITTAECIERQREAEAVFSDTCLKSCLSAGCPGRAQPCVFCEGQVMNAHTA